MQKHCFLLLFIFQIALAYGQAPTANFSTQQVSGCAPFLVAFSDLSTGSPKTWKWDFGNGITSTLQNPSATYFFPGTYTISLTVTNDNGTNTLTRNAYINVYDKPRVNFGSDNQSGCFPFPVQFKDSSLAGNGTVNTAWQWDFGNGTQSSQTNPSTTYTTAGNYTITLKVTNDKGCFSTLSKPSYIQVSRGLQLGFTNTALDRCRGPWPVTFTNTSTGPGTLTYLWDFGDGATSTQQNVTHTYASKGTYSVSLSVSSSSGCSDVLRRQNLISIQDISTSFSATDSICALSPTSFTNTSSPAPQSAVWRFGDGTTASTINTIKSFGNAGPYTVRLYNTYAYCTDSFSKNIQVIALPKPAFSASQTTQCKPPLTVNFKDASTGTISWLWKFGDGTTSTLQNPSHTYTAYGDYTVVLVLKNSYGCVDSLVRPAFIQIRKPVISFPSLPQSGCVPYTASLSASVNTLDNITSYLWDFGDGTTSTLPTPSHTYNNQGNYTVSLTVTTSTGCTETLTQSSAIIVGRVPVIDFTAVPNPVCALQTVFFSSSTNEGDGWEWTFGDGNTSTLQNPTNIYKDTGKYSVGLIVTNNGCRQSITKTDFISVKPPIARFGFAKSCKNRREFLFADSSIGSTTWFWDFGDGATSTLQNPGHIFNGNGNYTISLTVTSDTCSNTITKILSVFNETPDFTSDIREACKPAVVSYTSVVNDRSKISSYEWVFGDGRISTLMNPQVFYAETGYTSTTLITTDLYGCTDTLFKDRYVRINGPTARFSAINSSGCKGLNVLFSDTSATDGIHPIRLWEWNYGDGQTQSFTSRSAFQHVYPNVGNYSVQLTVTDTVGCKDSLKIDNLITTTSPKASFTANDTLTCLDSGVQFSNSSTGQNLTSQWSFGDSSFSSVANPSHIYKDTGIYNIVLKIKDEFGCTDSMALPNYVTIKKTTASFTLSDTVGKCIPYEMKFTNTSNFFTSSQWFIGNAQLNVTNPNYTFLQAGTYPITLIVTGRGGCVDSAKTSVTIYDNAPSKITYNPLQGCKPVFLSASVNSISDLTYYWDFGDGSLITTKDRNITHEYTVFGDYLPRLIVSDSANCVLPIFGVDTVHVYGAGAKFKWDTQLLCDSGTIAFTNTTTSNGAITGYQWDFGDGATSTLVNPSHNYARTGNYTVTLTAETINGCRDTATLQSLVKIVASPLITILGDSVVCKDAPLQYSGSFLRQDTSQVKWFWAFPNGNKATGIQPAAQRYPAVGNFVATVAAVNSSGCADTASKSFLVNPLPSITMPSSLTSPVGTPIQIQPVVYTPNIVSYAWTPPGGLSCTDCPQPVAKPKFNTTYTVVATDVNGCRNSASVEIVVFCREANVFVPNTFSPNGDGSNDVFYVRGSGLARVKGLRIFNRFGEIVFERQNFAVNDASVGWDGTFKGVKLGPDTYIYQLDVFCENSQTVRFDGSITLIR